jgi:hypothetical protein
LAHPEAVSRCWMTVAVEWQLEHARITSSRPGPGVNCSVEDTLWPPAFPHEARSARVATYTMTAWNRTTHPRAITVAVPSLTALTPVPLSTIFPSAIGKITQFRLSSFP